MNETIYILVVIRLRDLVVEGRGVRGKGRFKDTFVCLFFQSSSFTKAGLCTKQTGSNGM